MTCKKCGTRTVKLTDPVREHMGVWAAQHPLRDIPNYPSVPLFTTDDATKIQRVLQWSRDHPGQLVPEALLESVRAEENELERATIRLFVQAGLLESAPHVVWTFHATGLMPTEENFDIMPPKDQRECEVAWAQWDAMDETQRAEFARKMREYVAALPA